jgi:hypothetical protein
MTEPVRVLGILAPEDLLPRRGDGHVLAVGPDGPVQEPLGFQGLQPTGCSLGGEGECLTQGLGGDPDRPAGPAHQGDGLQAVEFAGISHAYHN